MDKSKWEYKKLGDCFVSIGNGATIKQIKEAIGIPITRIETLSNDVFNRDRMGYANIEDATPYSSYILNDGDILMSHINSMKFLGRAVEYKKLDNEVIIHGMNLLRLVPTSDFLSSYVVYQFQTDSFRKQIKAISHQAVNQASFNVTNLKKLNVLVPTLEDQQRIVAELDCLNEMIAVKQQQLKEFDKLAQSIFYDMFGDTESNSKGFEVRRLDKVCNLKAGKAVKAEELKEKSDGLFPCFGGNGIRGYIDRFSHEGIFPIIGRQGALCGNVNLAQGLFYATEHAVVVSSLIEMNSIWLFYTLVSMKLEKYAHGVAQPGLSVKDLNPLPIPLPPLSLQQQFADKISAIEAQKELVKQSIAETQHLFDSKMDYYFD